MVSTVEDWGIWFDHIKTAIEEAKNKIDFERMLNKNLTDTRYSSVKNAAHEYFIRDPYIQKKRIPVHKYVVIKNFYYMLDQYAKPGQTYREFFDSVAEENTEDVRMEDIKKDIGIIRDKGIEISDTEEKQMVNLAKDYDSYGILDSNIEALKSTPKKSIERIVEKDIKAEPLRFTAGARIVDNDVEFRMFVFAKDPETGRLKQITNYANIEEDFT